MIIRTRKVILSLARTTVHGYASLEGMAGIIINLAPIGICRGILVEFVVLIGEGSHVKAGILIGFLGQFQKLCGIEHFRRCGPVDVGNAILHVHGYVSLSLTTFLRGDQYHTVSAVCTIDGCRRGIFQHGDALYIIGIEK